MVRSGNSQAGLAPEILRVSASVSKRTHYHVRSRIGGGFLDNNISYGIRRGHGVGTATWAASACWLSSRSDPASQCSRQYRRRHLSQNHEVGGGECLQTGYARFRNVADVGQRP